MHVRRFVFSAAALFASTVSLSSVAFAQDAPVPSAAVTVTTPPPPPPQPPPPVVAKEDEQEPLRLGRFLELEAQRASRQRYGNATLSMIGGGITVGIGIGTYAYLSSNNLFNDATNGTLYTIIAVVPLVIGGVQILGGVIDLFTGSPMERLFEVYAPIAIRSDLTPTQRVARGEALLMTAAESERGRRITGAVTTFVLGAVLAGFAIGFGADNNIMSPDNVLIAASLGGAALVSFVGGVGALWWERGPAEIAWEQWHSMHEHVVVHTESKVRFAPTFAPIRGGATGGLSLVW